MRMQAAPVVSGPMIMKRFCILLVVMAAAHLQSAAETGSISVSPAALSLKGAVGATASQTFEISNQTKSPYNVTIDVSDVFVQQGRRVFVPANRSSVTAAAMVILGEKQLTLAPGEHRKVPVTFVMPAESRSRAVAVFFHAVPLTVAEHQPQVRLNLGAVVDYALSNELQLDVRKLTVEPQTNTTNTAVSEELANIGPEPLIARGVIAIISRNGALVGKASFQPRRYLPGEDNDIRAEFPGALPSGAYRVLSTIEFGGQTLTRSTEMVVP